MNMNSKPSIPSSVGAALLAFLAAYTLWAAAALTVAVFGLHLATTVSNPPLSVVLLGQFRDVVLPFLPAVPISALLLGVFVGTRSRRPGVALLVGAALAPASFLVTAAILAALSKGGQPGAYAAEQGMAVFLACLLTGFLSLTLVPFWSVAAFLLIRLLSARQGSI